MPVGYYFVFRTHWDGEKYVTQRVDDRAYTHRKNALRARVRAEASGIEAGESMSDTGYLVNDAPAPLHIQTLP